MGYRSSAPGVAVEVPVTARPRELANSTSMAMGGDTPVLRMHGYPLRCGETRTHGALLLTKVLLVC